MLPSMIPFDPLRGKPPEEPFVPDLSEGAETGVYLALLELIDEGLIITGDETIIDVNSAACRLLEREYRELANRPLADIFPDERAFLEARARLLIQGEMRGSLRVALPGGRHRDFRFVAAARLRPGIHALILSPDLLAETRPEDDGDRIWPRLAAALAQPVIVVDDQRRVSAANAAALESLGMRRDALIGQPVKDCLKLDWPSAGGAPIARIHATRHDEPLQARVLDGPRPGWHLLVLPAGVSTQAGTIAAPAASSPPARRSNQLAILNDQLELHFQPLVNARTGAIHSGEALLRWHHPVNGVIPFRRFAHAARDDGRLPELGGWALRAACRAAQAWPSTQGRSPSVTVNIAIEQILHGALVQQVTTALSESGIEPQRLELDLDEQVLVAAEDEVAPILHALAALGVRLAIDDFGHGLSTIRRLKRYPIQALKLDPELVRQVGRLDESDAVVESIVCMARPLGLKVLARGVENEAQQAFLLALECDLQQGPLFGPPMTAPDFGSFLSDQLFC